MIGSAIDAMIVDVAVDDLREQRRVAAPAEQPVEKELTVDRTHLIGFDRAVSVHVEQGIDQQTGADHALRFVGRERRTVGVGERACLLECDGERVERICEQRFRAGLRAGDNRREQDPGGLDGTSGDAVGAEVHGVRRRWPG